jgi:hypothetical protein
MEQRFTFDQVADVYGKARPAYPDALVDDDALSRDGSLVVFGHVPVGLPAPLLDQLKEIYLRQIGKWGSPPEAWYLPNGPFKESFGVRFVRAGRAQALRLEMAAHGVKLCGFFTHEVGPSDDGASEARRAAR